MVVIYLKGDGENLQKEQCLYETTGDTSCGDLTLELTKLQNMRVRLRFMMMAAKQLQKDAKEDNVKTTFAGPIREAEELLSLEQVERRRKVTMKEYEAVAEELKGCAIIAHPSLCSAGVESLCRQLDDDDCDSPDLLRCVLSLIDSGARTDDMLPEGATQLWWASKQLHHDDVLSKYSGRNEKTKLVCKLTKLGGSVPTKEPPVDAATQRDMMAYWHKKQEENKKLVVDEDISYGNAQWADPKGLKNHFQGTGSISWRPKLG